MARKKKQSDDEKLLQEAREAFAEYSEHWSEFFDEAEECLKFKAGQQWPDEVKNARENDPNGARPCLVMDRTNQYVRQVVNDMRQNKPSIKPRPVDNGADVKTAEKLGGLIRNIEDVSRADVAYITAMESAVSTGLGWWRIVPEVIDPKNNIQDIRIKRIPNIKSVVSDCDWQEPDGSDMNGCFIVEDIPRKKFERMYPDAEIKSWEKDYPEWADREMVRIAEWFKRVEDVKVLLVLEDGSEIEQEEYDKLPEAERPLVVDQREEKSFRVEWRKLTAGEILESSIYPAEFIGVIPTIGNEIWLDGKRHLSGLIKMGMDAQRMFNYANSAFVEFVALQPKAPFIAAAGQTENYPEWARANTQNISVLTYDPIDINGQALPAPQRQQPPQMASGWLQVMQSMDQNMQGAFGMYNASLGAPSNEKSGKAILARQREGDVATFHYQDNGARSMSHTGRILLQMIRKLYDTRRIVRILGEDGESKQATLDPKLQVPHMEVPTDNGMKEIFNPHVGTYDVTVSTGPAYSTRRQEAATAMMEMAQANPAVWQTHGDLMVKAQDWPMADQFAERFKAMLPPQIQGLEGEEDPKVAAVKAQYEQQMQAMQQGAQQAIGEREQALQQAGQQLQDMQEQLAQMQAQAKSKDDEVAVKHREVEVKEFEAHTERLKVQYESGKAEIERVLGEHEDRVKELMASCETKQPEAEQSDPDNNAATLALIQQSHEATMQAVGSIIAALQQQTEALNRPKVATLSDGRQIRIQ